MKKILYFIIVVFSLYGQTFNVYNTSEFRKALQDAATNGENNIIILAPGIYKITDDGNSTFKYNSSDDNNLTIKGLDSNNTILSGDNKGQILHFSSVNHKASLIVKNISFIDGNNSIAHYYIDDDSNGGGIYVDNNLYVYNCSFIGNEAIWGGGGFYAKNNTLVVNSYFKNNRVLGNSDCSSYGGGFSVENNATVINSKFYDNFSGTGPGGGFSSNYADVNDSLFVNNISNNYGGGFFADNTVVNNSIFNKNIANDGGGAVAAEYTAYIKDSNFTYNKAGGGGGISVAEKNATIIDCNFIGNENNWTGGAAVYVDDGLVIKDSLFKNNKVLIENDDKYSAGAVVGGNVEVYDSKFIDNNSTGLYIGYGKALIRNSIFDFNNGYGIEASSVDINNSFVSYNLGGGIKSVSYSVVDGMEGKAIIKNSQISNNKDVGIYGKRVIIIDSNISNNMNVGVSCTDSNISDSIFINQPYGIVSDNNSLITNSIFIKSKQAIYAFSLKASNLLIKSSNIGIYLNGTSQYSTNNEIYNTIFLDINNTAVYGNILTAVSYFENNYVDPLKLNVDIYEKKNNIFKNINLGFKDPEHNNYKLTASSDLINKGTTDVNGIKLPSIDLAGNPRIVGKTIDIGPYEYQNNNIETNIIVRAGWNMINIPVNVTNVSNIDALIIFKWSNKYNSWEGYSKDNNILDKLKQANIAIMDYIKAGDGVWVKEDSKKILKFENPVVMTVNWNILNKGWNLKGIGKDINLTTIPEKIKMIWYWDNLNEKWMVYSSDEYINNLLKSYYSEGTFEKLDKLEANKAYWFFVK